jgi:hypothetical protein
MIVIAPKLLRIGENAELEELNALNHLPTSGITAQDGKRSASKKPTNQRFDISVCSGILKVELSAFNKAVVAMILALSIGLQWPLLQSIAWLNMLVTFSAQDGLQQAVVKTFDGKHPCKICKLVSAGRQAEKKAPTQHSLKKFDPMLIASTAVRFERKPYPAPADFQKKFALRVYSPLEPPPDFA